MLCVSLCLCDSIDIRHNKPRYGRRKLVATDRPCVVGHYVWLRHALYRTGVTHLILLQKG